MNGFLLILQRRACAFELEENLIIGEKWCACAQGNFTGEFLKANQTG
jgi:hypothetical protein